MYQAPIPENEPMRLATLHASQLLQHSDQMAFDRITRLGRHIMHMPICQLNLVDAEHIRSLSRQGGAAEDQQRQSSFCGHTILGDQPLVIQDTRHHPYFFDHPLVLESDGIRSYIGIPIRAFNGCKIATLCMMDRQPKAFSADDLTVLKDLAAVAEQTLATSQLAIIDDLTSLMNRRGFESMARMVLSSGARLQLPAILLYFDLDGFKSLNDHYGQAEGDRTLMRFGQLLKLSFRDSDVIGRLGSDEFAALLFNSSPQQAEAIVDRLRQLAAEEERVSPLLFSVAAVHYSPQQHSSLEHLLSRADRIMYQRQQQKH